MDIGRHLPGWTWSALPAAAFRPRPGDRTTAGATLSLAPSLTEPDEVKFAALTDLRFRKRHLYHKLLPFLPREFTVTGPPDGRKCWMEALGIHGVSEHRFRRPDFDAKLGALGYTLLEYDLSVLRERDIIVYCLEGLMDEVRRHAALYLGSGRVQSRWGIGAPLMEHPLLEVPPSYWNKDPAFLCIERPPDSRPAA